MAPYKLLWSPGSCASVVQLCLETVGAEYEFIPKDELAKLSPLKQIPVLILPDGTLMTESVAMILRLDDDFPGKLLPARGTPERAQAYRWLLFTNVDLHETVGRWYYAQRFTTGDPAGVKEACLARLAQLFEVLEQNAFQGGPYVLGKEKSACDWHVCMTIEWLGWTGTRDAVFAKCPKVKALREEMHKDPLLNKIWVQNKFIEAKV
ncbi:hypothetical protein DFJ74DRAFT_671391 [Hyaloraphidium curvatum]|nr:hypothetical protein DFJ74DRAFT_671391 [Hyaloraphidium curvatum]